jgi:hypothetical protein
MTKLPQQWCILNTLENVKALEIWREYGVDSLGSNSPHRVNGYLGYDKIWSEEIPSGYTEITFEQFKQHFMTKLPKHWYIKVTEENQSVVSKWRLANAKSFFQKEDIGVGLFVMSDHSDGSCYYGSCYEEELNNEFPSHESINFKTFLQITGMQTSTYTVTREQFLQGHELACSQWQERLTKKFAVRLIKSDTIEVDDEFVQLLRGSASNDTQREFLNKLFVDPNLIQPKDLKIGEAMRVKDTSTHRNGTIVLKTYDGFVDINDPQSTWGKSNIPIFKGVRVKLNIEAEEC